MKFVCLSRDYRGGDVEIYDLEAEDESEAWEDVEETISGNMTQEWLFDEDSWNKFIEQVKTFGQAQRIK